ncbi:unnamed protein product [Amaranthus hypochondriacus]
MDYKLGALKLMCQQLKEAIQTPSQTSYTFKGVLFQRVWLQGILISVPDLNHEEDEDGDDFRSRYLLDDGTGLVELLLTPDFQQQNTWSIGMYVMVVGAYADAEIPLIKVHKIVDLSAHPNREAMWYLEIIEACRMFYQLTVED